MRMAYVGNYPIDRTSIRGGVQSGAAYLLDGLCQQPDLEIHVITASNGGAPRAQTLANGATLHVIPPPPRFSLANNFRSFRQQLQIELDRIQPDVIHSQEETHYSQACLKLGYPTVVNIGYGIRREDSKHNENLRLRLREEIFFFLIERYCLRHAPYLISPNHYVTDYYKNIIPPRTPIAYIANAISRDFFESSKCASDHTILFAGRVMLLKRVLNLVKAMAKLAQELPDVELRIAGECETEPDYVAEIRSFIQAAGLNDRVKLLGQLTETNIVTEFAHCTLLALPSIQESNPLVIEQAMASGKPVVATAVGGVPEMVEDGRTGFLVKPDDVADLTETLQRLLTRPEMCQQMGRTGKEKACQKYHSRAVAEQTSAIYRELVPSK